MKKDEVVVLSCSVCSGFCYAVKYQKTYQKTPEFVICKDCFGLLK